MMKLIKLKSLLVVRVCQPEEVGEIIVAAHRTSGADFAIDLPEASSLSTGVAVHFFGEFSNLVRVLRSIKKLSIVCDVSEVDMISGNILGWRRIVKVNVTKEPERHLARLREHLETKGIIINEKMMEENLRRFTQKRTESPFIRLKRTNGSE